jgi:hypothetical protein
MRGALDHVVTKIPNRPRHARDQSANGRIDFEDAADGQTTYDGLVAAAADRIQAVLSMLM